MLSCASGAVCMRERVGGVGQAFRFTVTRRTRFYYPENKEINRVTVTSLSMTCLQDLPYLPPKQYKSVMEHIHFMTRKITKH